VKHVIEFDMVCENFRGSMEMLQRGHYFQCLEEYKIGCKPEDFYLNFFLCANGIARFGGLNLLALPTKARILCLEYSSLRDFGPPLGNNNNRSIFI